MIRADCGQRTAVDKIRIFVEINHSILLHTDILPKIPRFWRRTSCNHVRYALPPRRQERGFSPRPAVLEGGFVCTPIIHYFSVENQPANDEFESKVIQPLRQAVQALEYTSFFMTVSHAGFEMSTAIPVVLVVAKNLTAEDARLIDVFDALSCESSIDVSAFQGKQARRRHPGVFKIINVFLRWEAPLGQKAATRAFHSVYIFTSMTTHQLIMLSQHIMV